MSAADVAWAGRHRQCLHHRDVTTVAEAKKKQSSDFLAGFSEPKRRALVLRERAV